jgi:hypothetical protein
MTREEIRHWASDYIAAQEDPNLLQDGNPKFWAVMQFMLPDSEAASVDDCWQAILAVIDQSPSEHVKNALAAGALEDLIHHAGPEIIDRLEKEAAKNAAFRDLLPKVWESSTPEVWARVQNAARGR